MTTVKELEWRIEQLKHEVRETLGRHYAKLDAHQQCVESNAARCRLIEDRLDALEGKEPAIDWTKYACPTCMHWGWLRADKSENEHGMSGECTSDDSPWAGKYGIGGKIVDDFGDEWAMPEANCCAYYHKREE